MVKKFWSNKVHRRINDALSIVELLLASYLILAPFAPNAGYYTKQIVAAQPENKSQDTQAKTAQLYIPKIDFDQPILEGESAHILSRGIWRRPNTSNPDLGGNTVIV